MAITAMAALAVAYVALQSFEQLIEAFILASLPFWALSVGSVFVFRRKHPEAVRVYRTPGYPFVPLLFVVAMTALVSNSLAAHPGATLTSLGAIAAGIPLYLLWRHRGRPLPDRAAGGP